MVTISNLPVTQLSKHNYETEWPALCEAIEKATIIAIDLEMSGLGSRKETMACSIEERYKSIVKLASSFSVVSLGISCFKMLLNTGEAGESEKSLETVNFENRTYNILTVCSSKFTVEPDSVRFLIKHGLDMNKLFTDGIEYYQGNDLTKKTAEKKRPCPRDLINKILSSNVPVAVHNGLIDLVFLYQNFYAQAPDNLMKFVADLSDMFKGGLYDTKFISEYFDHPTASFLEFLYRKALLENSRKEKKLSRTIGVSFAAISSRLAQCELERFSTVLKSMSIFRDKKYLNESVCETFASFGFCPRGGDGSCDRSHNIDFLMAVEMCKSAPKSDIMGKDIDAGLKREFESSHLAKFISKESENSGVHSAGVDSFMTGFVLLHYLNKFKKLREDDLGAADEEFGFKVYLIGKDYPLIICKSNFASHSSNHQTKKLKAQS